MPVVIRDRKGDTEIDGELVCPGVSTWGTRRWMTIEVYRLASGNYLIHRTSRSNVYHTAGTGCTVKGGNRKGEPATVADLPDEAEPCRACRPPYPDELADEQEIRYEFTRHSYDKCETPAQVIAKLTTIYKSDGSVEIRRSKPVTELLEKLAEADPEFEEEPLLTRRWA